MTFGVVRCVATARRVANFGVATAIVASGGVSWLGRGFWKRASLIRCRWSIRVYCRLFKRSLSLFGVFERGTGFAILIVQDEPVFRLDEANLRNFLKCLGLAQGRVGNR